MGYFNDAASRAATLLLTSSLLVAGCSSSSDSPELTENDNAVSEIDSLTTTDQSEADSISNQVSDEVTVTANDPVEETSELVAPASENIPAETIANEQNSDPTAEAVLDPFVQNRTQVDFGITVPAYQSDALQVRLTWGDTDVTAGWVGDELWSTSLELPTNTENLLTVTFSDQNGAITLASFEQVFRTGTNEFGTYQITSDQFDTIRWDTDGDGVSNLDELIVGTNPLIADVSLPMESVGINSAENIAQIFDIVGGAAVDVMSSAARALEISINESGYLLLSTTSDGVAFDNGLTLSDTRIYECPISGTVSKVEVRQEGVGFWNNLEADDCRDLDQVIDGEFTIGSRWTPHGHAFTTSNNATLSLNDDTYRLEAEQLHQQLNFNEEIRRNAFYVGADIQLSQNGISIYRVGSLNASEGNMRVFRSTVSDIVTSGIDIDEIETTIQFSKNESSEYFTTGTFVGSKNDIEVLVVDADTGDENTFSGITTSTGSTISAIYDWSPEMQFGRYPLPDQ